MAGAKGAPPSHHVGRQLRAWCAREDYLRRRLGAKDDSTPVVQAIIDLGHAMGLRVVAEGVSAAHLREDVAAMGCELAQGFYWAPPLPVQDFVRWWQEADRTLAVPGLSWGEPAGSSPLATPSGRSSGRAATGEPGGALGAGKADQDGGKAKRRRGAPVTP
jgi:hypothetical protein